MFRGGAFFPPPSSSSFAEEENLSVAILSSLRSRRRGEGKHATLGFFAQRVARRLRDGRSDDAVPPSPTPPRIFFGVRGR